MEYKFIISVVIVVIFIIIWCFISPKNKALPKLIGTWNKLSSEPDIIRNDNKNISIGYDIDTVSSVYSLKVPKNSKIHIINGSEAFKIDDGYVNIKLSGFAPKDYWEIFVYEYPSWKCISVLSRPESIKINYREYIMVFLKIWRQKEILNKPDFVSKIRFRMGYAEINSIQGDIFSGGDIELKDDMDILEEIVCSRMNLVEGSVFFAERIDLNIIDNFFSSPYSYTYHCEKNINSSMIAIISPVRTRTLGVVHHSFLIDFGVKKFVWYPTSSNEVVSRQQHQINFDEQNQMLNNMAYIIIPVPPNCKHVSVIERIAPMDSNSEILPARFYS